MSELKEVYEFEIARNREGDKLAYMSLKDGETGYRIAGPKAWGGSTKLEEIEIRQDELVEFVLSYAPQALVEILRRAQPEANADAKDMEPFGWIVVNDDTAEWDCGEVFTHKDDADFYMENNCASGWHLEPVFRQSTPTTDAAIQAQKDGHG